MRTEAESPPPQAAGAGPAGARAWRRRARGALLGAARACGWLGLRERAARGRLTVLTYHRVLPDEEARRYPFPSLAMPESAFARQADWLAARAEVAPLGESLQARGAASRPRVAITFDDGYRDNAELAAPILGSRGLRATFFVASGFVGGGGWMWYDRAILLAAAAPSAALRDAARAHGVPVPAPGAGAEGWVESLKRVPRAARAAFLDALPGGAGIAAARDGFLPMRPEQVGALAVAGHEIGSHSVSHDILTLADDGELERELRDSKRSLADWTGAAVHGFCYPNGTHDARVAAAAARAGYLYACTTLPPSAAPAGDPFRLARRDVVPARVQRADGAFDLTAFRAELAGLFDGLRGAASL